MGNRFDYVKYDDRSVRHQNAFKEEVKVLEKMINSLLVSPRARALALTKLEEVYMWVGKAIRDDQIDRNGTAELQEERTDQ